MRFEWREAATATWIAAAAWLWAAETVAAGTYDVHGCRLPDGTRIAARGWSPTLFSPPGSTSDECRAGGSLTAALNPDVAVPALATTGWEFNAPQDTEIAGYVLHRSSVVARHYGAPRASLIYHDAPVFDGGARRYAQELCITTSMECTGWGDGAWPLAPTNRYARSGLQMRRLILTSECFPTSGQFTECPAVAPVRPRILVHASRISLSDVHPPAFTTPPSGALLDAAAPIEGRRSASFIGEDRGGGVVTVGVVVDGHPVSEQPADPNVADCRQPYTAPVPCPLATRGSVEFDTSLLANGPHQIALALTDAGGNRTLSIPVTMTVRNPGAANGARASRFARLRAWFATRASRQRTSATLSFGRTRPIVGRLADESGAPIADAVLDISATATRPGSRTRVLGQVATDANGEFRYLPRSGASRRLTIGYRAFHLDAAPSATASVDLRVRAGLTLAVRPRRVSPRGRIEFSGRLRGGPGRAGTQVVIYAVGARKRDRIPVATVRANSKGRFRYRYRFQSSSSGTTYRFQTSLHSQRGYPYATGSSRPVTVRIR